MIFIVIPVHDRKEFTRDCLLSLRRQTLKNFEAIVVDDGSIDGTSQMLNNEFPEVHVVNGDGSLWWAGATNAGIEYILKEKKTSDFDFILTLNNDLQVPEKYLETLVYHASCNEKVIVGSVSVDINNLDKMNFCGVSWNEFTGKYHSKAKDFNYSFQKLASQRDLIDSDMLPGRGTLIPIGLFSEIGFYDAKNFPQYAADEDFSLRAKRNGWTLLISTNTCVMSHITAMGADIRNARFSFSYYKYLFFSIRSPLNLKIRYRWAMKNSPLKMVYFLLDITRIMLSITFKSCQNLLLRAK